MDNKTLGKIGETMACEIIIAKGYDVLDRNYRCKAGEIDIIAAKRNEICFIEVKTRQNLNMGTPAEAVDLRKQLHIRNAAKLYMQEKGLLGPNLPYISFEVMEILVNHIRNAF